VEVSVSEHSGIKVNFGAGFVSESEQCFAAIEASAIYMETTAEGVQQEITYNLERSCDDGTGFFVSGFCKKPDPDGLTCTNAETFTCIHPPNDQVSLSFNAMVQDCGSSVCEILFEAFWYPNPGGSYRSRTSSFDSSQDPPQLIYDSSETQGRDATVTYIVSQR
jgi:hypothetical protein